MLVSHGRVLDHLRVSITDRCQLRCTYCMPGRGVQFAPAADLLTPGEIETVVRYLVHHHGLRAVRITGGEPLLRADLPEIVARVARLGLADLAMTTNAEQLPPLAADLRRLGLQRLNISLDSLDPARFAAIRLRGRLDRVLAGIDAARAAGFGPLKLNCVLLGGLNTDELPDLVRFAARSGAHMRFLELMAIGEAQALQPAHFFSAGHARAALARHFDLTPLPRDPGATAADFHATVDGRPVTVGFISPVTEPFCRECRRLRLTATGELIGCLMRDGGPNLRDVLRRQAEVNAQPVPPLDGVIAEAVAQKPYVQLMVNPRRMHAIGG